MDSLGMCGGTGRCVCGGVYETTGQCQCMCVCGGRGVGEDGTVSGLDRKGQWEGASFRTGPDQTMGGKF